MFFRSKVFFLKHLPLITLISWTIGWILVGWVVGHIMGGLECL